MNSLTQDLEKYTYSFLMQEALSRVPDTVDTREGSIIYDTLAGSIRTIATFYQEARRLVLQTYVLTSSDEWLAMRTLEFGVNRYQATFAHKRADFSDSLGNPISIPIGSRWVTISQTNPVYYTVNSVYTDVNGATVAGAYRLICEQAGTIGNEYTGNIIPLSYLPNVAVAVMSTTLEPGQNEETDDELRERYIIRVNQRAFGGNIAQYREWLLDTDGIRGVQVYPVWDGGGTVKCSIIDAEYMPVTPDFLQQVQQEIDPENYHGLGIGVAPIGHWVTMDTPQIVNINIRAEIILTQGYELSQTEPEIVSAIDNYLSSLRTAWGNASQLNIYSMTIFISQIIASIHTVQGVAAIESVLLNGKQADLILTQTAQLQQIPVLGEVAVIEHN
jgi:uncharacterized phage protein gp47/JayE